MYLGAAIVKVSAIFAALRGRHTRRARLHHALGDHAAKLRFSGRRNHGVVLSVSWRGEIVHAAALL